tara:strand:- start:193 stop:408 length:216 start_codon:yes stop_codon:yes gene_type:complete
MRETKYFISKSKGGYYNVEVVIDYEPQGGFITANEDIIDDLKEYMKGENDFWNFESREQLEIETLKIAQAI